MPTPAAKEEAHGRASYTIDPIHGPPMEDAITRLMEKAWAQAGYAPLPPAAPPVIGWRLALRIDGRTREQREFSAGEDGFAQAQRDGGDWLHRHGQDGISRWLASAAQASRRMDWDHGYRHAISLRGF